MNKVVSEDIDVMRGLAALGVIVGHSFSGKAHVIDGAFWVWIFMFLSGYLQGHAFFSKRYALNKIGIVNYWINRGLRILPLFWLAVIAGWGMHIVLLHQSFSLLGFLKELLTLTSEYANVGPLWTIACEVQFYVCVPMIVWLFTKQKIQMLFSVFVLCIAIYLMRSVNLWDDPNQARGMLGNLYIFFAGIGLAYFFKAPMVLNEYLKF